MSKIAFICVGNSCRSQMAEAIAKKLYSDSHYEFVSAGAKPEKEIAPKTLEVLKEIGIIWNGKPKDIRDILNKGHLDIVVTMGCEVACPFIPGAKIINWEIPDPKGKDIEKYRETLNIIKNKVAPRFILGKSYRIIKGGRKCPKQEGKLFTLTKKSAMVVDFVCLPAVPTRSVSGRVGRKEE